MFLCGWQHTDASGPLLAALNITVNFASSMMSTDDGTTWVEMRLGPRGEHLLRLDDGDYAVLDDESGYAFDFITSDTANTAMRAPLASENSLWSPSSLSTTRPRLH